MNSKYVFYIGIVLTLSIAIISFSTSLFDYIKDKNMNTILSILLVILGLIITDRISTISFFEERLEKSIRGINSQERVEIFPSASQAMDYFINIEKSILVVKNTSFKFHSHDDINQEQLYTRGLRKKWYRNKKKLVENNVNWREIGNFVPDPTFREFVDWAKDVETRRYSYSTVNVNFSSVNFLHLLFDDGKEEVLFGWSYAFSRPMDSPVFRSNNLTMCKYYSSLFDFIESNCVENDV